MDSCERQAQEELQAQKQITAIYQGKLIKVDKEEYTTSLGPVVTDIVTHPGAVGIIPILDDGKIILIRQWRRAVKEVLLEIPAGTLEEGEDPAVCAMRELQEETGYRAATLKPLSMIYTCPGFCTERIYLFAAYGLTKDPLVCDDHEVIEVVPMSLEDLHKLIAAGSVTDSKTISAISLFKAQQAAGALP